MRICTWNIQLGVRLDEVLDAVRSRSDFAGVDLLALQEASAHHGRPDAEAIAAALGLEYRYFQATVQRRRMAIQANGLIWRQGAFEPRGTPRVLPLPAPGAVPVRRMERALLRAVRPQARTAVCAESEALRVYVVHLDVIGFGHKLEQFKAVIGDLAGRPPVPLTLVAGDLNTFGPARGPLWRGIAASARAAGLVNLTAGIRRTHWTGQKLDAIYALAAAPFSHRAWTLKVRASDHLPVFAEIKFRAP